MCTRFVYHGDDVITGFNFDIDLSVWTHRVMTEKERFYIRILRPDGPAWGRGPFSGSGQDKKEESGCLGKGKLL